MLKITKKVEYALIAIKHLSENPKKLSSVSDMSTAYGIPREILAKTMQTLAKENIVESVKGPQGGYRNKNKTSDISLNKFFEVLEGPTAIMDCYFESGCNHLSSCNIKTPINKINDSVRHLFDNITLADIS
tara:strand:+ start:199 stop:591 length:393 start_codon:yes stop_codon:yes gene_type:complete